MQDSSNNIMKENTSDPRELLAEKLHNAGIDGQKAFFIALDAGRNLVDKEYLKDCGFKGKHLKAVENIIKEFYWENQ
ncbi:MAG: hypothetical protein STSR0002_20660 [Smithella sp.]